MTPPVPPHPLWVEGDPFEDLRASTEAAGDTTVITARGTARLFRFRERGAWQSRVPLESGHVMATDGEWRRLDVLRATPCGISTAEPDGSWTVSTPLRAVLIGHHPEWLRLPSVREIAARSVRRQLLAAPSGHPETPCGSVYCCELHDPGRFRWWR